MSGRKMRKRRTDYGTVLLHWLLVGSLIVALATGLRIATEAPDHAWVTMLDGLLPRTMVWTAHMPAALVLAGATIAYAVYMILAGLGRRVQLDRVRLAGLFGRSQARWGAINVILYWVFYASLVSELVTGAMLYFGFAGHAMLAIHWLGTWIILGYALSHVLAHWQLGGVSQLMRIFRPTRLVPPPPPLDAAELLVLLAEHTDLSTAPPGAPGRVERHTRDRASQPSQVQDIGGGRPPHRPSVVRPQQAPTGRAPVELAAERNRSQRRGPVVLQANPFAVAIAAAIAGTVLLVTVDRQAVDTLHIRRINHAEAPALDGDTSDPIWRSVQPLYIRTVQGGNFDETGETTVEIRAVHDGMWAYFLFVWDDPTRSLKQLPLQKAADGWHFLHAGYETGDEYAYNEDKFSVLLTKLDVVLAGDRTFHAGSTSLPGMPATLHGRGLHYTMAEGVHVDVWQWKATSTGPFGWMENNHFGLPAEPTPAQIEGRVPYKGGFLSDPASANYFDNFEHPAPGRDGDPIKPRRLPRNLRATMQALGKIDLAPDHSDSDGAKWYMTIADSVPYSEALDAQIPVGAVIPGVITTGEYLGDRAEIRCSARWAAGRWALTAARRLDTHDDRDVPISTGTFMRVAAFDHSQIRHTRHVRPIRLEVD